MLFLVWLVHKKGFFREECGPTYNAIEVEEKDKEAQGGSHNQTAHSIIGI